MNGIFSSTIALLAALSAGPCFSQADPNFGLPAGFSVEKMDRSADPRRDFARYAAGRWLDAAAIPGDGVRMSPIDQMTRRVDAQVRVILDDAARGSRTATRGTPLQQVGDHFTAGMDTRRIDELGVAPLAPVLARIDAIDGPKALAVTLARLNLMFNDPVLAGAGVATDPSDRTRYAVYVGESGLSVPSNEVYLAPTMEPVRAGLRKFVADVFVLAGIPAAAAQAQAVKVVEIEALVAAKKLSPVGDGRPGQGLRAHAAVGAEGDDARDRLGRLLVDPKADAAVNLCALGAVIGHEITHGFDSQGRLYDTVGNVRNWWTPKDAQTFNVQATRLVTQANGFEVLPGLRANGALAVGENLADVGGVSMAYAVLQRHLRANPKQNVKIDGLRQDQRCFIAWAQVWAEKANEGWLRQSTATDPHPPGRYRASAAPQHEPAFYRAFGIRPGDPMWLAPKDRVAIW